MTGLCQGESLGLRWINSTFRAAKVRVRQTLASSGHVVTNRASAR